MNLEIELGIFGLLGPDGAGKTSLARIMTLLQVASGTIYFDDYDIAIRSCWVICGRFFDETWEFDYGAGLAGIKGSNSLPRLIMTLLQSCTSGTIYFDDYDIAKDRKAIRSLLGYLPQDFRFFEKLKTWEFLDYGAGLAGIKGKQHRAEVVDEMLRKVGLFEVRDRWANRLSGGMKRRLGIAQAIIGNPKVIIVDEPTTGLDPEERIRFRNILSDISDKDSIIILSTHIVGDISSTCKKLALLNRGELKFEGSPDEMINLARGKVWEIFVTDMEYEEIKDKR